MTMKGPEDEFNEARDALEEALRSSIKSFAKWMAKNWTMSREEWIKAFEEAPPADGDYFKAYNAGVESVLSACDHFLDEYPY